MKKYELILQGGKTLVITEQEKRALEEAMLGRETNLSVGNNRFKSSMIKGIFEIKQEVSDNKEMWIKSNREWHEECLKLSKRSIREKIDSEMVVRIFPGLKLDGIVLSDEKIGVLEMNLKAYFDVFPKAPRCPMRIWWPIISEGMKKSSAMSKWWNYVSRNDGAIEEWMKYQV